MDGHLQVKRYISKAQTQHLRCYFAVNAADDSFEQILASALIAVESDLKRIKVAKILQLFFTGKMTPEKTARLLESFCQHNKPHFWQFIQFARYQHLKKFVKSFKFVCLRELFLAAKPTTLASPYAPSVSVNIHAMDVASDIEEQCQQMRSFFQKTTSDTKATVLHSVQDYLEKYRGRH